MIRSHILDEDMRRTIIVNNNSNDVVSIIVKDNYNKIISSLRSIIINPGDSFSFITTIYQYMIDVKYNGAIIKTIVIDKSRDNRIIDIFK